MVEGQLALDLGRGGARGEDPFELVVGIEGRGGRGEARVHVGVPDEGDATFGGGHLVLDRAGDVASRCGGEVDHDRARLQVSHHAGVDEGGRLVRVRVRVRVMVRVRVGVRVRVRVGVRVRVRVGVRAR